MFKSFGFSHPFKKKPAKTSPSDEKLISETALTKSKDPAVLEYNNNVKLLDNALDYLNELEKPLDTALQFHYSNHLALIEVIIKLPPDKIIENIKKMPFLLTTLENFNQAMMNLRSVNEYLSAGCKYEGTASEVYLLFKKNKPKIQTLLEKYDHVICGDKLNEILASCKPKPEITTPPPLHKETAHDHYKLGGYSRRNI